MKKYVRVIVVALIICSLMNCLIFAKSDLKVPIIEKKDTVLKKDELISEVSVDEIGLQFQIAGNYGPYYAPIIQPHEIIISENSTGIFKKGKSLYLKVENLRFHDFIAIDQLEGNLKYDYCITNDGLLKITILEESTTPVKLKVHQIAVVMEGHRINAAKEMTQYVYSYPLVIKADKELENNMFVADKDYFICSNFVMQQEVRLEIEWYPDLFTKVVVAEEYIDKINQKYSLENHCYIKNGYLMVPVKEGLKCITGLETIWDNSKKEAVIQYWGTEEIHIPVGENWMNINGQTQSASDCGCDGRS